MKATASRTFDKIEQCGIRYALVPRQHRLNGGRADLLM
jgi:hypothetical protein